MTRGVYLLLAFLFVFSMVNLVNTLMTNLLARQQEIGILQSVGMTGKQVSRMLIAECLWYAGVTVLLFGWYRRNPRLDFGLCDQQF